MSESKPTSPFEENKPTPSFEENEDGIRGTNVTAETAELLKHRKKWNTIERILLALFSTLQAIIIVLLGSLR